MRRITATDCIQAARLPVESLEETAARLREETRATLAWNARLSRIDVGWFWAMVAQAVLTAHLDRGWQLALMHRAEEGEGASIAFRCTDVAQVITRC